MSLWGDFNSRVIKIRAGELPEIMSFCEFLVLKCRFHMWNAIAEYSSDGIELALQLRMLFIE